MAKPKKPDKVRIQFVIDTDINEMLDQFAEKERRTKSSVVELALLAFIKGDARPPTN
jgi:predicted transcriptional regulator